MRLKDKLMSTTAVGVAQKATRTLAESPTSYPSQDGSWDWGGSHWGAIRGDVFEALKHRRLLIPVVDLDRTMMSS